MDTLIKHKDGSTTVISDGYGFGSLTVGHPCGQNPNATTRASSHANRC